MGAVLAQQAMLQQQQQQARPPQFFRPPPNMVPQPQPHLTGHPQYQQYYQHYQQQILRQQQQWQRNNFHQNQFTTPAVQPPPANAYNRAGGSTDPSNWNHNTATTAKVPQQPPPQLNTNLQQVKAKETVLTQQPVQQGIAQSAPTANLKTRPGQGRGVSQQPAWMQNVNNNDSIAVETSVPRNNSLNNVVPPSQTEKARRGRGRGRGRGSDINKPAWMTENSNKSASSWPK